MQQKVWSGGSPYSMLDRRLKGLGLTMLISTVWDVLIAVLGLVFPFQLAAWMRVEIGPGLLFYWQFWPLVHLILPCFCILAWMDTKHNIVIVAGAILVRVIYGLYMLAGTFWRGAGAAWAVMGGISLVIALVHYILLRLSDFGLWEVFSRAGNPPTIRTR